MEISIFYPCLYDYLKKAELPRSTILRDFQKLGRGIQAIATRYVYKQTQQEVGDVLGVCVLNLSDHIYLMKMKI